MKTILPVFLFFAAMAMANVALAQAQNQYFVVISNSDPTIPYPFVAFGPYNDRVLAEDYAGGIRTACFTLGAHVIPLSSFLAQQKAGLIFLDNRPRESITCNFH